MENTPITRKTYTIEEGVTDYSISTLIGLSISIVTMLFAFTLWAIQVADIEFLLLEGKITAHGDLSLLYFSIFLICATMLIVVQYHFQRQYDKQQEL